METPERKDVYAIVTDHIIAQLEKGVVPWQKPWGEAGIPRNLITEREYRGINVMLLNSLGYSQNLFLSFKQAKSIGATIKRGEKAHLVVFWKMVDRKNETNVPEGEENGKVPMLRYYMVFNVEQCIGIPVDKLPPVVEKTHIEPISACEGILDGYPSPPKLRHGNTEAYYAPAFDLVSMPHKERFQIQEEYYSTLFHELVHSTGHESRLNRPSLTQETRHGSELYSFEELIAEIGTCFLCSHGGIGITVFQNSTAYIGGWLKRLKGEKRWVVHAAAQAQKAVDFILNIPSHEEASETA